MKRSQPLRRLTPLRRTPMRESPRARAKREETMKKRREIAASFGPLVVCAWPGCRWSPDDLHEIVPRGRGGSPTDKANTVPVCRYHHSYLHNHPNEAHEMGLLRHSWEKNGNAEPEPGESFGA